MDEDPAVTFLLAAAAGDVDGCEAALAQGVDIDVLDTEGACKALHTDALCSGLFFFLFCSRRCIAHACAHRRAPRPPQARRL